MASRYSLPLNSAATAKPTLETIRQKLGGREASVPGAGAIVQMTLPSGEDRPGVVLFASETNFDLWLGDGIVRRVPRKDVRAVLGEPPQGLVVIAGDVRLFNGLEEGQRVRCGSKEGRMDEGKLLEKCRYGALVARDDGVIVAAGFQRIWPAVAGVDCN
jgi:hypothetical protein